MSEEPHFMNEWQKHRTQAIFWLLHLCTKGPWWVCDMETLSALLALYEGNPHIIGRFPSLWEPVIAIKQQGITWANGDTDLCRHMSLVHNKWSDICRPMWVVNYYSEGNKMLNYSSFFFQTSDSDTYDCEIDLDDLLDLDEDTDRRTFIQVSQSLWLLGH